MWRGRIPAIMQAMSLLLNGRIYRSDVLAVADAAFA
jgi:hypothetical protein